MIPKPRSLIYSVIAICLVGLLTALGLFFRITSYGSLKKAPSFETSFREVWVYIPPAKTWEKITFQSTRALGDAQILQSLKSKYGQTSDKPFSYSKLFESGLKLKWIIPRSAYSNFENPSFVFPYFYLRDVVHVSVNQAPSFQFQRFKDPFFYVPLHRELQENTIELSFEKKITDEDNQAIINLRGFGVQILESRDALGLIITENTKFDFFRIFTMGILLLSLGFVLILYSRKPIATEYGYHAILMSISGIYYIVDMRKTVLYLENWNPGSPEIIKSFLFLSLGAWLIGFILSFFRIRGQLTQKVHSDSITILLCVSLPFFTFLLIHQITGGSIPQMSKISKQVLLYSEFIGLFLSLIFFQKRWAASRIDPIQKYRAIQCLIFTCIITLSVSVFSVTRQIESIAATTIFFADLVLVLGFCSLLIFDYLHKQDLLETADMQQNPIDIQVRQIGAKALPQNMQIAVSTFDIIGYTNRIFQPLLNGSKDGFHLFHQRTLSLYFLALRALKYDSMDFAGDKITAFFILKTKNQTSNLLDSLCFLHTVSTINQKLTPTFQILVSYYQLTHQNETPYQIRSALDARIATQIWLDRFTNTVKFLGDVIHLPARMENLASSNEAALTHENFVQLKNLYPEIFTSEPKVLELTLEQQRKELKGIGIPVPKIVLIDLNKIDFTANTETMRRYENLNFEIQRGIQELCNEIKKSYSSVASEIKKAA